jgi:heptosyltransferase-1
MRVLIIKLTSMGDLMHVLPAITDAVKHYPEIEFDWVVDQAFAAVPHWHPNVRKTIVTSHRVWRKNWFASLFRGELKAFYRELNTSDYDVVIDMQNNIKSAIVSLLRRGPVHGVDKACSREKPAHLAYAYRHHVPTSQHAVTRMRQLMAAALNYPLPTTPADSGIEISQCRLPVLEVDLTKPYLLFVHNASWLTKLWPVSHWQALVKLAEQAGYQVLIPCGNDEEYRRAQQIASVSSQAHALSRLPLDEVLSLMQDATGAVCSDTGLAHMAAMLGKPAVTIYGSTDPALIGTHGAHQEQVMTEKPCAPCYKRSCPLSEAEAGMPVCMDEINANQVWHRLEAALPSQ